MRKLIRLRKQTEPSFEAVEAMRPGIQLEHASLCFDCETVFPNPVSGRCPHCGSASTRPLAYIIEQPRLGIDVVDSARRKETDEQLTEDQNGLYQ
ncbi:hypothetical protein DSCW_18490 [Desulfosarcina widdelii]|uniref:Uncharacterized protein n=1 Tax=Desulfosarcina widdelii TaxID=947919 RepID=A0A5K7YXC4_9BACT|nr:hypothetical protein [Desulfosarcina widdelii]BBO74432.1 hypothetical protein DSCW_18490 [Desulfosarcina widdelii]